MQPSECQANALPVQPLGIVGHNAQPAGTDVRAKLQQDCQQAKCYTRADLVLHHRLYSH